MSDSSTISVDFETHLITNEVPIPPPVCLSICWSLEEEQDLIHARDPACKRVLRDLLEGAAAQQHKLCGWYIAYDMMVASRWFDLQDQAFAAYGAEGIHCNMVRQKLIDLARGQLRGYREGSDDVWVKHEYSLDSVSQRYGIPALDKDTWRLRYGELENLEIKHWPEGARLYALDDTAADLAVHLFQREYQEFLDDEFRQAESSFNLSLISAHGQTTDKAMVDLYRQYVQEKLDRSRDLLLETGYTLPNKKGKPEFKFFLSYLEKEERYKRSDKYIRAYALDVWAKKGVEDYPKTDTGGVCLDEDAVKKSGDEILIAYQLFSSASTAMNRVDELEAGTNGRAIHTRFDELLKSGRTSSSKPNVQNRATEPVGDRESFIPGDFEDGTPGLMIDMDFDGLELRTIAQGCIHSVGFSRLAEVLNEGEDPHLMVAAKLCNTTYDDAKVRYKQKDPEIIDARGAGKAKMVNFSCWAGTTVNGLRRHAADVGYNYSKEETIEIYNAFLESWPEAPEYFAWVKRVCGQAGIGTMACFGSNRIAGYLTYTESCSVISQGLGADATKEALRALCRECWYKRDSLLYGCLVYNFIHDQYQVKIPDGNLAHERAEFAGHIVREAANKWLPDVPTRAKPMLVRRWSKMAEPVKVDGRLIPWDLHLLGDSDPKGKPWPEQLQRMIKVAKEQEERRA
jgi:hypothetical protein